MKNRCERYIHFLLSAAFWLIVPANTCAQQSLISEAASTRSPDSPLTSPSLHSISTPTAKQTVRLVCARAADETPVPCLRNVVVVGFVGGFVNRNDAGHPEVQFANYLRDRYASSIHAEVFANHQGKDALRRIVELLGTDRDGGLTANEKEQARIIICGHSWGASQMVTLARELRKLHIPVLLTVQIDSVRKSGQDDSTIPSNVEAAANFYQARGLIHGRPLIHAEDMGKTRIIGNFRMSYENAQIDLHNCRWMARIFNKPHLQIENDPRLWDQIASIIDSELWRTMPLLEASSTVASPRAR